MGDSAGGIGKRDALDKPIFDLDGVVFLARGCGVENELHPLRGVDDLRGKIGLTHELYLRRLRGVVRELRDHGLDKVGDGQEDEMAHAAKQLGEDLVIRRHGHGGVDTDVGSV